MTCVHLVGATDWHACIHACMHACIHTHTLQWPLINIFKSGCVGGWVGGLVTGVH